MGLDGSHLAPPGAPFSGSMESPSSSAVTSVYSGGAAWLTGVPGSETPTGGGVPAASAAVLSSVSGRKWSAAFAGERCMGERPGDGVTAQPRSH